MIEAKTHNLKGCGLTFFEYRIGGHGGQKTDADRGAIVYAKSVWILQLYQGVNYGKRC